MDKSMFSLRFKDSATAFCVAREDESGEPTFAEPDESPESARAGTGAPSTGGVESRTSLAKASTGPAAGPNSFRTLGAVPDSDSSGGRDVELAPNDASTAIFSSRN